MGMSMAWAWRLAQACGDVVGRIMGAGGLARWRGMVGNPEKRGRAYGAPQRERRKSRCPHVCSVCATVNRRWAGCQHEVEVRFQYQGVQSRNYLENIRDEGVESRVPEVNRVTSESANGNAP